MPAEPVDPIRIRAVTSAGVRLVLAECPPRTLGIAARPNAANTGGPKITGAEALTVARASVALDGPMFSDTGQSFSRFRFRLLDRGAGLDVPSRDPRAGYTLSVVGNVASVAEGSTVAEGATFAVQCYPTLAKDGERAALADTESNNSRVWRAAVALMPTGLVALVVGVATLRAFATALAALGVRWAGYTDGGSSTELRSRLGPRWGYPGAPRVPAWVVARGPLEDTTRSSSSTGGGSSGALVALLALGGLAAWWWTARDAAPPVV